MPDIVVVDGHGSTGRPAIAALGCGDFALAWNDGRDIQARIIRTPAASPAQFQVNAATDPDRPPIEDRPAILALPEDAPAGKAAGFVVAWVAKHGVFFKRFAPDGTRRGNEVQVSGKAPFSEGFAGSAFPALAASSGPEFMVAWANADRNEGVRARRFTSSGAPASEEFQVNTEPGIHHSVSLVGLDNGSFAVAWRGGEDVHAARRTPRLQIFAPDGTAVTEERTLDFTEFNGHIKAASFGNLPGAEGGSGRFVIVHGSGPNFVEHKPELLMASVFGPDGTMLETLDITVAENQTVARHPDVAPLPGHGFVVVWEETNLSGPDDPPLENVKARILPGGSAAFFVGDTSEGMQTAAGVATTADDQGQAILIAWTNVQRTGSGYSVVSLRAQILRSP